MAMVKAHTVAATVLVLIAAAFYGAGGRTGAAATIYVQNCTDRAFCLSGCRSFELPADTCIGTSNPNVTQALQCSEEVRVCGDISTYSDSQCAQLLGTQGFVCNECNDGQQKVVCEARGATSFISVERCSDHQCGGTCTSLANITAGVCWPSSNGRNGAPTWSKYTGATLCNAVRQLVWLQSPECDGRVAGVSYIAEDSCMGGMRASCRYGSGV